MTSFTHCPQGHVTLGTGQGCARCGWHPERALDASEPTQDEAAVLGSPDLAGALAVVVSRANSNYCKCGADNTLWRRYGVCGKCGDAD